MQITSDLLIKDVGCKKTERERERDRETQVVVLLLMGMNKAQCFACRKEREQPPTWMTKGLCLTRIHLLSETDAIIA